MRALLFIATLLCSCSAFSQEKFTLSGYVSDEKGEMLPGVYIVILNSNFGTATNVYGFYSITLPRGNYSVHFSFIGYQTNTFEVDLRSPQKVNVSMQPVVSAIDAVTITAERKDENITETTMSNVQIPARIIRKIPGK